MPWLNRRSLCLLAALTAPAGALTPLGAVGDEDSNRWPSTEVIGQWIDQLGASSYRSRRASQRRLLELSGSSTTQADRVRDLLLASKFPTGDLELDLAKQRLVSAIDQQQAELRMDQFLHDPRFDKRSVTGWEQFARFAGSDLDARLVFAAILDQHPSFGHVIAGRVTTPSEQTDAPAAPSAAPSAAPDITTWFAALAMACQQVGERVDEQTMHMVSMLRSPGAGPEPSREHERQVCKSLVGSYLSRAPIDARDRLVIAARYGCKQIVESECRRVLSDPSESPSRLVTALLAASATELDEHELRQWTARYRHDPRVSHVWRSMVPPKTTRRTQVRDVALAVELHRSGIDPRERGYDALEADPILVFRPYSLGFESESERAKTHAPESALR